MLRIFLIDNMWISRSGTDLSANIAGFRPCSSLMMLLMDKMPNAFDPFVTGAIFFRDSLNTRR